VEFVIYYTLTAVMAYFLADWLLDRIEVAYGRRFKYRNVVFFFDLWSGLSGGFYHHFRHRAIYAPATTTAGHYGETRQVRHGLRN
jgi:hypothetical protein